MQDRLGYFWEAAHNLTDGFEREKLNGMALTISNVDEVKNIKDIRARSHGNNVMLDVVVSVDSALSLIEGHRITEKIETTLKSEFNITDIIIHVELMNK